MTTHAEHDAEHGGTWATLAEAASVLGCSVDTIRRRIRRGELHAMQEAGRHGPTWRVLLSATPSTVPTVSSALSVDDATPSATLSVALGVAEGSPALFEALRMLDALRQENRDLAGQVGYFQARAQILDERVKALEAPKEEPAAAVKTATVSDLPPPGLSRRTDSQRLMLAIRALAALAVVVLAASAWVR